MSRCFEAIHHGHRDVHEDTFVKAAAFAEEVNGLLAVGGGSVGQAEFLHVCGEDF